MKVFCVTWSSYDTQDGELMGGCLGVFADLEEAISVKDSYIEEQKEGYDSWTLAAYGNTYELSIPCNSYATQCRVEEMSL